MPINSGQMKNSGGINSLLQMYKTYQGLTGSNNNPQDTSQSQVDPSQTVDYDPSTAIGRRLAQNQGQVQTGKMPSSGIGSLVSLIAALA